jgi:DNA-binding winged helix-turn-helix (wHTH) protein/tetratricopeptide (TPR) repeat protein
MDAEFHIGSWRVQPRLNTVSMQNESVRLEPKAMQVLVHLAEHAGEVVPKERLFSAVWPGTFVTDDVLTRAISGLRRIFCDDPKAPQVIQTIPKMGYRLIAPILPVDPPSRRIHSLLVLPLVNESREPDADYLSDGITECLINVLSQLPQLKVVARSTAFRYKGASRDPAAIARELGVGAVVTGRIALWNGSVTVQAELVDPTTGSQTWGHRWTRPRGNLLCLPEDLARDIAENLKVQVSGEQQRLLARQPTAKPEAYQLYLKARYLYHQGTEESVRKAIEVYEQAVGCDPGYALAYAGLADSHSFLTCQLDYGAVSPRVEVPLAEAAARRALELDNQLAAGHSALASILKNFHWDWEASEREFRAAIALSPGYPKAHQSYADLLMALGRFDEALAQIEAAHAIDPFSVTINTDYGFILYVARDFARAIDRLKLTLDLRPDYIPARSLLSFVLERTGAREEAAEEYQRALALTQGREVPMSVLGRVLSAGQHDELRHGIERLRAWAERRYVPACWFAALYTRLGEADLAFHWMERARDERSNWLIYLLVDPLFDDLRSDARFHDLVQRVGLPSVQRIPMTAVAHKQV